jgi:biofilm PGA synthesis N-glycosyltransferase PgaC
VIPWTARRVLIIDDPLKSLIARPMEARLLSVHPLLPRATRVENIEPPAAPVPVSPARDIKAPSLMSCSVGIMAYNEEANIASAINAILGEKPASSEICELVVVASGCTDRTVEIVQAISQKDARVRLIVQERRMGKAAAINVFVETARSPILLMVSADVLVNDGTIDAMLRHFQDGTVGMVGGHPIPVNDETTFLGHAVHLLWRLHDRLARVSPKLGEIVAFRNVVPPIPADTAVDEISIQALVSQLGFRLVYEPDAVVYNHGPTTTRDFLRQRRRIYAGHLRVRRRQAYEASSMSVIRIMRALMGSGSFASPRTAAWTTGAIALEACARILGQYDHIRHRSHHIWETATTTKRQLAGADRTEEQSVLVFNIVNFHRLRLELGLRRSGMVTRIIGQQLRQAVGFEQTVSVQRNGTIVAVISAQRAAAEATAHRLVEELERSPIRFGRGDHEVWVKVACGIIAFSQSGQTIVDSISPTVPIVKRAVAG